jgi:hypothetical protein
MISILDQYEAPGTQRIVRTYDDLFAVHLAQVLGDGKCPDLYRSLVTQYPHAVLADAARRLIRRGRIDEPIFVAYFRELTSGRFAGPTKTRELIAFKIERLTVGVAVFIGSRLLRTELRKLGFAEEEAFDSAAGLVRRFAEDYPDASFAVESCPDQVTRRARTFNVAVNTARALPNPVWSFTTNDLHAAFSSPPCKTREEMRAIVPGMHLGAEISSRPEIIDAVAIGLVAYCRLLLHIELEGRGSEWA